MSPGVKWEGVPKYSTNMLSQNDNMKDSSTLTISPGHEQFPGSDLRDLGHHQQTNS